MRLTAVGFPESKDVAAGVETTGDTANPWDKDWGRIVLVFVVTVPKLANKGMHTSFKVIKAD